MTDPFTIAAAALGKGAAAKVGGNLTAWTLDWFKGDEFSRLLEEVAERLAPGVGVSGLAPLREDENVVALVAAFLDDPGSWDESQLVKAIEPHVGPLTPDGSSEETAAEITRLIRKNAWAAFNNDREAIVHTLRAELQPVVAALTPRFLSLEWVPRQALEPVRRLSKSHAAEAGQLEAALQDEGRRQSDLANLIRKPQSWAAGGSSALWTTFGDLALSYGMLDEAEQAIVAAVDRAGADRVRLLSRAAQVARIRGKTSRAKKLLAEARGLDPDHPALAIAEARAEEDPQKRLDILASVVPQDALQTAGVESDRAMALLSLGKFTDARRHSELAAAADPDSPVVRELAPVITLVENSSKGLDDPVDSVGLGAAAAEFLSLREELLALGRRQEAAMMLARASDCYVLAGDTRRARGALGLLSDEERKDAGHDGIRQLASAALDSGQPALAREWIEADPKDDRGRFLLAQALLATEGDPQTALGLLDELIETSSNPTYRAAAASTWLLALLGREGVSWNEKAREAVAAADPVLAQILVAARLINERKLDEAERILLPLQQSDPRALELLGDIATERGDWKTALHLQRQLIARGSRPERRLREARLLEGVGDLNASLASLAALRIDATVSRDVRATAFGLSAQTLYQARKFSDFVDVARSWRTFAPDDDFAGWALVRGLAHLAQWEGALAVIDGNDASEAALPLHAVEPEHAILAAKVYANALPPADAVRRIAELSDRFDRSVEELEALVIIAGVGAEELPADLIERRTLTWADFQERFPDSTIIRAYEAPTTAEEIEEFAREHIAPGTDTAQDVHQQVRHGQAAMALLAAALGRNAAEVWAGAQMLPLGYGDASLDDLERADAKAALGKPAVWDTSSIYVAGGLGDEVLDAAKTFLPASVVAQSTLDDIAASVGRPIPNEEGEQMLLGWNTEQSQPQVSMIPAEEVARARAASAGMFEIVRGLRATEDADKLNPGRLDDLVTWSEDEEEVARPSFLSWPATFAVAARLNLPIYSDDRFVRLEARKAGIAAFGTVALLDVLVEQGDVDPATRETARRRLRASFGMGLVPPPEDVVAEARAAEWRLGGVVGQALLDPTSWRDIDQGFRDRLPLLAAAVRESEAEFPAWVKRVLDAAHTVYPAVPLDDLAAVMLAHCWMTRDGLLAKASTDVIRDLRSEWGMRDDPIAKTFGTVVAVFRDHPKPVLSLVIRLSMRAARLEEQLEFLKLIRVRDEAS